MIPATIPGTLPTTATGTATTSGPGRSAVCPSSGLTGASFATLGGCPWAVGWKRDVQPFARCDWRRAFGRIAVDQNDNTPFQIGNVAVPGLNWSPMIRVGTANGFCAIT